MSSESKKLHVTGFKFFRSHKQKLIDLQQTDKLSAAAIGSFMFVLDQVLHNGELPSDYKHSKIVKEYNVKYSTYTTGLYECIKHNLVNFKVINNQKIYYVVGYQEENRSKAERPNQDGDLSYFKIPGHILRTATTVQELIKTKNAQGLIEFIKMYDRCYTGLGMKKGDGKSVQNYDFQNFKNRVKWSAKKLRQFLDILSPVLKVDLEITKIKQPRQEKKDRVRKPVKQIIATKFQVCVSPDLLKDKEANAEEASLLKDGLYRLSAMGLNAAKKDSKGLRKAIKDKVLTWKKYMDAGTFKDFSRRSLQTALDQLESYVKSYINQSDDNVRNIPAYISSKLTDATEQYLVNLDEFARHDIAFNYYKEHGEYPAVYQRNPEPLPY